YRETGDERVDGRAKQMAEAYGAEWLVRAMPSGERAGLLFAAAAARGVAAMIAESGGIGQLEADAVARHVNGVQNILRAGEGIVLFVVTSPAIKKDGLLLGVGVPE